MTKLTVVGAGAIGGYFAARIARAAVPGLELTVLARGDALRQLREQGITVLENGVTTHTPVVATDDPAAVGPQDVVLLCLKSPALMTAASQLAPLIGPQTIIVPAMNGVPWWLVEHLGARFAGRTLAAVDAGACVSRTLPPSQVLGCVLHMSSALAAPGVIHKAAGHGVILGLPHCNPRPQDLQVVAAMLEAAEFEVTRSGDIAADMWLKLWGNMTTNPISALTRSTCDVILDDPLTREFAVRVMLEAKAVGEALGWRIALTPEQRHEVTRRLGRFKTSTLQDLEAGRPLETDALVAAPYELAQWLGIETPWLAALLGLSRQLAANHAAHFLSPFSRIDQNLVRSGSKA